MSSNVIPCAPTPQDASNAMMTPRADAAPRSVTGWLSSQVLLPLAAFLVVNVLLVVFDGDRWLASHLFAWEGGRWALRDAMFTQRILHTSGRDASTLAWLVITIAAFVAWRRTDWARWRRPLACLSLSVLIATSLVAVLKHLTNVDCPWDVSGFGGTNAYVGLFAHRSPGLPEASGCFPAGHASAGYSWVALYFFLTSVRPSKRWIGLGVGLALGLVFGVAQQLRGAHFVSHDLWSLMVCWLTAVMVYRVSLWRAPANAATSVEKRTALQLSDAEGGE